MLIDKILYRQSLSFKDERIFRIANIIMICAIVVMIIICVALYYFGAVIPFWASVAETVAFILLFVYHLKGYYIITRYVFLTIAISMQVYGSLYHGENGGFDFLFFATAFVPVLFFDKKIQYLSLFIYSTSAYLVVKILYDHVEPIMPFDRQIYPYYTNLITSAILIYFGLDLFKSEHLKYERDLKLQKDKISSQKETLQSTKDQLLALLESTNKRLQERDDDMTKYAYLNSHKARSPLARILGLANLTNLEDLDDKETREYYFNEIMINAKELDHVLREISRILDHDLKEMK